MQFLLWVPDTHNPALIVAHTEIVTQVQGVEIIVEQGH